MKSDIETELLLGTVEPIPLATELFSHTAVKLVELGVVTPVTGVLESASGIDVEPFSGTVTSV